MRRIALLSSLIIGLLFAYARAKWESPVKLAETGGSICSQASYTDPTTGTLHVVYGDYRSDLGSCYYYYTSLSTTGTISAPLRLSGLHKQYYDVSITGPGDGRTLYATMCVYRDDLADIYFVESHDNGASWSQAASPRGTHVRDRHERHPASLVITSSGRLYVFYKLGAGIIMTTRPPGSTIWSSEFNLRANIHTADFFAPAAAWNESAHELSVGFMNLLDDNVTVVPTVIRSKNGGITWNSVIEFGTISGPVLSPCFLTGDGMYFSTVRYPPDGNPVAVVYSVERRKPFVAAEIDKFASANSLAACYNELVATFSRPARSESGDRQVVVVPTTNPITDLRIEPPFSELQYIWYTTVGCHGKGLVAVTTVEDKIFVQRWQS